MNPNAEPWQPGMSWLHYDYVNDASYVYVNIPKNASCWMKENFGGYQYDYLTKEFVGTPTSAITRQRALKVEPEYLVVLRDPLSRWISGTAQYFWGWDLNDPRYYKNIHTDRLFEQVVFDDHTRPQVSYLETLDHSRITWFDCTARLVEDFQQWIKGRFDIPVKTLDQDQNNSYNVSARGGAWPSNGITQQQIVDDLRSLLDQNPQYQQLIRDFYAEDYRLRDSVRFYGTR